MISARGRRTDITNILLEGEHIDLDIQENVSACVLKSIGTIMVFVYRSCFSVHTISERSV